MTVTSSFITNNTGATTGGGFYNASNANLTVINTDISNNSATSGGGISNNLKATLTVQKCTISKNSSSNGGGLNNNYSTAILSNVLMFSNTSTNRGSALNNVGGALTLTNGTIVNHSNVINNENGNNTLRNCIFSKNTGGVDGYNILSDTSDWKNSPNIFCYDPNMPLFVDADNDNYHLAPNSQAINMGDNTHVSDITNDIEGNKRICNDIVDLGAYEYQGTFSKTVETPSIVVTTANDIVNDTDGLISLREAIEYSSDGDIITFTSSLSGSTITLTHGSLIITKEIGIDASSLAAGLTVNGNNKNSVFQISGGTTAQSVTFTKLTITGGKAACGGGIYVYYGTQTLRNCTISGNSASNGGGIDVHSGTQSLYNTIIAGNTAKNNVSDIYKANTSSTLQGYNNLSSFTAWNGVSGSGNNFTYDSTKPLFVDAENGDYTLSAGS